MAGRRLYRVIDFAASGRSPMRSERSMLVIWPLSPPVGPDCTRVSCRLPILYDDHKTLVVPAGAHDFVQESLCECDDSAFFPDRREVLMISSRRKQLPYLKR